MSFVHVGRTACNSKFWDIDPAALKMWRYYSQGSFVQLKATAGPEFGGAKSDIGTTIIEMLEVAESDFTRPGECMGP